MTLSYSETTFGQASVAALWTTFGFELFATFVFLALGFTNKAPKRQLFINLSTLAVASSALAYLIMALGDAQINIGRGYVREFQWLHYADWTATTPIIFTILGLLAGVSWTEIVFYIGCALLYVGALFAGAMSTGLNAIWPLFTFGVVALLPVFYALIVTLPPRVAAAAKGAFTTLSAITMVTLAFLLFIWATGDGSQAMAPDQETICYAVADILGKVVFGFVLVFSGAAMDAANGISTVEAKSIV